MERTAEWIVQAMLAKGLRITGQRRTLANIFARSEDFLSSKEVYRSMSREHWGLSHDTVYRNLRMLHDIGVLEQFHFENGIKFRFGFSDQHEHRLICLNCSRVILLAYCPLREMELPQSFQIVRHRFDTYGYCVNCQDKNA